jgi:hypothetical protein
MRRANTVGRAAGVIAIVGFAHVTTHFDIDEGRAAAERIAASKG